MLKAIACTLALMAATTFASAAAAQEQDFTLINHTGHVVVTLNVSPASENRWGPDLLGREVLANNEEATLTFTPEENECVWDIRVTFGDGDTGEYRGVNLCELSTVTLDP